MKRVAVAASLVLAACGGDDPSSAASSAFPDSALTTVASESGALSIEIRTAPEQPPERGVVDVEYRITDGTGQAKSGLDVAVEAWMPDMGHGASTQPTVAATDDGTYVASKVNFFMPGRWELHTTLGSTPADHATVTFQIP